jgi:hypothetical protein
LFLTEKKKFSRGCNFCPQNCQFSVIIDAFAKL